MKKISFLILLATILSLGFPALGISQEQEVSGGDIVIIVNQKNPTQAIKKSLLRRYFFKKTTKWADGSAVAPIDLLSDDATRKVFSRQFLNQSTEKVERHWISQVMIGGKEAPRIVKSSAAVKNHVANHAGGIGYIVRNDLDSSVRAIEVFE